MENKQFESISRKMDNITKLLAFNVIKDKTVNEQIALLTKLGFKVADIAQILDKKENQIYVTQTLLKKKKKEPMQEDTIEQQTIQTEEKSNV